MKIVSCKVKIAKRRIRAETQSTVLSSAISNLFHPKVSNKQEEPMK